MIRFSLRLTGALLALALLGSNAANAQTAPLPSGSFTPAQPPAAQPPAASAAHLAVARDLVVASGLARAFGGVIPDLMVKINTNVGQTRPELAADLRATLDQLQSEFMRYPEELLDFGARVYASVLSEQECRDALVFFKSPVGLKYVESQPAVLINMGPAVTEWSRIVSVRMLDRVRAEMKKKGREF